MRCLQCGPTFGLIIQPCFQDLYRAQTLIPHKRSSMVSLDTIRKDPRWRDPNLREVISMLSHPMDPVKSNAAAYLQHLCYENDTVKQDVQAAARNPRAGGAPGSSQSRGPSQGLRRAEEHLLRPRQLQQGGHQELGRHSCAAEAAEEIQRRGSPRTRHRFIYVPAF